MQLENSRGTNTKRKGNTAEALAIAAFVAREWVVLLPFGDNEPYDCVINRGSGFERVQVKKGRFYRGCLTFNAYSQPGRRSYKEMSYSGLIDFFAVPYEESIYIFPEEIIKSSSPWFRLDPPLTHYPNIRWAKDFLLGPIIP